MQGNAKVAEGSCTRTGTPGSGTARTAAHLDAGRPVVAVDAKKKEKVGEFANGGADSRPKGGRERVEATACCEVIAR